MSTENINQAQDQTEDSAETRKKKAVEHMARFREILAEKHEFPQELKDKITKFRERLSRR